MLLLSETLINKQVLSLRTGGTIAQTYGFVINPNNLKIEGFYCHDRLSKQNLILLNQDIRNIIGQGIIVNDHDVLSTPDILVRLKEVLKINYILIGKPVNTINKEKVGRIKDFAIDSESFFIQKLYVGQTILKSINSRQLSIDRNQVVEVTDNEVIIQSLLKTEKIVAKRPVTASLGTSI